MSGSTTDHQDRLQVAEQNVNDALRAYALTLKVELRASPHSETESSVKESLRKFRFVADSQLEILKSHPGGRASTTVFLETWEYFSSRGPVREMWKAWRDSNKALDALYAIHLDPDQRKQHVVAAGQLGMLCKEFCGYLESPRGLEVYTRRIELFKIWATDDSYTSQNTPANLPSNASIKMQLLALCSESPSLNSMRVISSWAERLLKRAHMEMLERKYRMARRDVAKNYVAMSAMDPLTDSVRAQVYKHYITLLVDNAGSLGTHRNAQKMKDCSMGLAEVLRKYGRLLGFANDINDIDAMSTRRSLSHRAPIDNRFKPQARF